MVLCDFENDPAIRGATSPPGALLILYSSCYEFIEFVQVCITCSLVRCWCPAEVLYFLYVLLSVAMFSCFLTLRYVVFVFVICLICVCCCLLNMCRAVFVPIRSVMDVRMHVIISLRHRCSNSRYYFYDFVWRHCFPLANHIRSTRKLLIALTFIRVKQHCMHWMKQYVVVCVFHHKLINVEYKDLSK